MTARWYRRVTQGPPARRAQAWRKKRANGALPGNGGGHAAPAADVPRRDRARPRRQGAPRHPGAPPRCAGPDRHGQPGAHRRSLALPARSIRAPPGSRSRRGSWRCRRSTPRSAGCSACSSATPTTSRSTPPAASWCRPRCAGTRASTSASCWSGQGRKFELWDEAQWQVRDRAGHRVPRRRPAARAGRLLAVDDATGDHVPVLLEEAMAALAVKPDGMLRRRHVRPRRPRARHARAPRAGRAPGRARPRSRCRAAAADALAQRATRASFSAARGSPSCPACSPTLALAPVDGVLFDLGISSPQIDDAARGFSFRIDGPLDMRMDPTRGESAAEFLARATVRELTEVIRDYGEERFAQSIARAIAAARARAPIVRTRPAPRRSWAKPSARARGVIGVRIRPRARSRPFGFS